MFGRFLILICIAEERLAEQQDSKVSDHEVVAGVCDPVVEESGSQTLYLDFV